MTQHAQMVLPSSIYGVQGRSSNFAPLHWRFRLSLFHCCLRDGILLVSIRLAIGLSTRTVPHYLMRCWCKARFAGSVTSCIIAHLSSLSYAPQLSSSICSHFVPAKLYMAANHLASAATTSASASFTSENSGSSLTCSRACNAPSEVLWITWRV